MATAAQDEIEQHEIGEYEFRKIVVATDFSSTAEKALKYAAATARQHNSEITIVHAIATEPRQAVPMDPLSREMDSGFAEAELQMARLNRNPCLAANPRRVLLRRGTPPDVLSSFIEQEKPDLLVLGTRARAGLKKIALGFARPLCKRTFGNARLPI